MFFFFLLKKKEVRKPSLQWEGPLVPTGTAWVLCTVARKPGAGSGTSLASVKLSMGS